MLWEYRGPFSVREGFNAGKNLKHLRNQKGLTIKKLSELTEIPKGTLSTYECCGSISKKRLEKLADFYDIRPEALIIEPFEFVLLLKFKKFIKEHKN